MRLDGSIRERETLEPAEIARMFELLDSHFEGVVRARFEEDLSEKRWVLLIHERETGLIQGFSTAMLLDTEVEGQPVRAIYSGDTIIAKEFWGEKILGTIFLRFVVDIARQSPEHRVFWFLISMGYKTYRLLRLFFREYWPRHDAPTPAFEQHIIDRLGALKFGGHYDPDRGVVSFDGRRERLRDWVADDYDERQSDPDIRFFVEHNPGHSKGDELACVAEISESNFRPVVRRIMR